MALRTYIDVGVLIAAIRGDEQSSLARAYLFDPLREYVVSDYMKLELLPQCRFHRRKDEEDFYQDFFARAAIFVPSSPELLAYAIEEGGRTGVSGIDAMHVACALVGQAQELITTEKPGKPMHKATGVKVISVYF